MINPNNHSQKQNESDLVIKNHFVGKIIMQKKVKRMKIITFSLLNNVNGPVNVCLRRSVKFKI